MALAALAALGTRVPIVFARRVDTPLNAGRATRLKYARARRIISVSRAAVAGLVEAGVDPSRVDVIPSGIPLGRCITPASRELLAGLGVPPDVPLAVQVSALVRHKNPLGFVHAIAAARRRVPALHALLVGEGPLREEAAREVRALGLETAVHLTGFRTDPEALTAAADVVVLSSVAQEGTPGVLMDAMALGRPVAAMAAGGVPEVVEQGVSGIVVPIGDSEALGDAIAEIVSDPARASRMGAAGVERAKCFDIQRTVDRTIEVYRSLLAESER
jgi:glycosyltransferase involved in cell wall biosynthesis